MTAPKLPSDGALLTAALEDLERVGCQFWMCEGPTLEPEDMVTCHVCATVAQLRQRLGQPVDQGVEGCRPARELERQAYIRKATGRAS